MRKLKFAAVHYFKGTQKNVPMLMRPIFWLFSPLAIVVGALMLPEFMMHSGRDIKDNEDG
jgi:hypothetical protein